MYLNSLKQCELASMYIIHAAYTMHLIRKNTANQNVYNLLNCGSNPLKIGTFVNHHKSYIISKK